MRKFDLRALEIALILFSLLLFGVCLEMYVTGFPLRYYIFDLHEDGGTKEIGKLDKATGSVRREIQGQGEFTNLQTSGVLYDSDTIVTDSDTTATIALNGGGSIELGPSSMVRLSFENQLSLAGITRFASVEIVQGTVAGKTVAQKIVVKQKNRIVTIDRTERQPIRVGEIAKPKVVPTPKLIAQASPIPAVIPSPSPTPLPSPSPSPLPSPKPVIVQKIRLIEPALNQTLTVPKESINPSREVTFEWKLTPTLSESQIVVFQKGKTVFSTTATPSSDGTARVKFVAKNPGKYEWQVGQKIDGVDKPLGKSSFSIDPEFESIRILEPLIAGQKMQTNALTTKLLKSFDITLQWEGYPGASKYRVQLADTPNVSKALLERAISGTKYQLNKNRVYSGRLFYRVTSVLPNGFVATSPVTTFEFNYLPPTLVLPADQTVVSKAAKLGKDKGILFTWRTTNFTEGYDLEVARDDSFKTIFLKENLRENFYVFKLPDPGKYFWRVRSYAKNLRSQPSKPSLLVIAP